MVFLRWDSGEHNCPLAAPCVPPQQYISVTLWLQPTWQADLGTICCRSLVIFIEPFLSNPCDCQVLDVPPQHAVQRRPGPQRPGDAEGEHARRPRGVQCQWTDQSAPDPNTSWERKYKITIFTLVATSILLNWASHDAGCSRLLCWRLLLSPDEFYRHSFITRQMKCASLWISRQTD